MKINLMKALLIGMSVFSTSIMAATHSELDAAHEAYLNGKPKEMTLHLRNVLMENPNESVKRNALELLQAAYANYGARDISPDWKLPQEIRKLKLGIRRVEKRQEISYTVKLSGNTAQKNVIKSLSLIKYPNTTVLETNKIGEYSESPEANSAEGIYFELVGPDTDVPASEGLYLLNIELNNGNKTNGWVIVTDMLSTETPKVTVPSYNQIFSTSTPTFQFEDFKSPQYKANERRSVWMGAIKLTPPAYQWFETWGLWTDQLPKTQATVGSEGYVGTSLPPAHYLFCIVYAEERRFGDVRLGRESQTATPFSVK